MIALLPSKLLKYILLYLIMALLKLKCYLYVLNLCSHIETQNFNENK